MALHPFGRRARATPAAALALVALAACRTPVAPEPARTSDHALVEVPGDELCGVAGPDKQDGATG